MLFEISQKFIEKHSRQSNFLIKLRDSACYSIKKQTVAYVFSCEFFKILGNTLFTEHVRATASDSMIEVMNEIVNV